MAEYVGRRIVPRHAGVWVIQKEYEELMVVLDAATGDSYISRLPVPAGTALSDENYWMLFSLYSAQIAEAEKHLEDTASEIREELAGTEKRIGEALSETESRIGESLTATENRLNARVDVVGDISDPEVRRIVDRIDNNRYLEIGEILPSTGMIASRFEKNEADAAVCFGQDFSSGIGKTGRGQVKIIGDGSDPNSAQMVVNYVMGVLRDEQADVSASLSGQEALSDNAPSVQLMYNPAMKSAYNFVPGVMGLILMMICSMMTSVSIVREKEMGTMELLLVSPVKPLWIIVSKVLPYLLVSTINFITILLLSRYMMGVPLRGSLLLLSGVAVLFVFTSLSLGLLISVVASTQKSALLLSGMGLMMPTVLLSGIIFPCENMPVILQCLSHLIPAKWFIIIVKKIMIQGAGFPYIIKEFCILAGMTFFLMTLSVKKFRVRL